MENAPAKSVVARATRAGTASTSGLMSGTYCAVIGEVLGIAGLTLGDTAAVTVRGTGRQIIRPRASLPEIGPPDT